MVIDNTQAYQDIWDWIDETLHFSPNVEHGHDLIQRPPFRIPFSHTVYGIDRMNESHLDDMERLLQQAF